MIHIGQRLREARVQKGYTIEEVAKATKIRSQFISSLERGNYVAMPSSAYVYGFVKNYVDFLGLPQREFMALFRREFDEREYIGVLPESFTSDSLLLTKLRKSWRLVFMASLVLLPLFAYLLFQYRTAFFNPKLIITVPNENAMVNGLTTQVLGKTDSDSVTVTVNDIPVVVDSDGNFKKSVIVFVGESTITIKAQNKAGRISTVDRHIQVKPAS